MSDTGDLYGPWWEHRIVFFDVETTGLEAETGDRIVEVGFACFEQGVLVEQWGSLVHPGRSIPKEASDVHGISDADVADAPRFVECLPQIFRLCWGAYPAAYNAGFDQRFLMSEMSRLAIDGITIPIFDERVLWFDPITWVRERDGIWAGNKLTEACERYGVSLENAHSAVADCTATGKLVYDRMVELLPKLTIHELVRRQQFYAKRHDDERRAWFEKKGIPYR